MRKHIRRAAAVKYAMVRRHECGFSLPCSPCGNSLEALTRERHTKQVPQSHGAAYTTFLLEPFQKDCHIPGNMEEASVASVRIPLRIDCIGLAIADCAPALSSKNMWPLSQMPGCIALIFMGQGAKTITARHTGVFGTN